MTSHTATGLLTVLLIGGCAPDPEDRLIEILERGTQQMEQMIAVIECAEDYPEPEARWYACSHLLPNDE
mgnify:CR=1 FL=1